MMTASSFHIFASGSTVANAVSQHFGFFKPFLYTLVCTYYANYNCVCITTISHKLCSRGDGVMVHLLRALGTLPEDLIQIANTQMTVNNWL